MNFPVISATLQKISYYGNKMLLKGKKVFWKFCCQTRKFKEIFLTVQMSYFSHICQACVTCFLFWWSTSHIKHRDTSSDT